MSTSPGKQGRHTAGAFDIRNFIGILLGLFGLVLLGAGVFAFSPDEAAKTGGVNANLWAGLVLVVMSAIFLGWAWLRPVVVPEDFEGDHDEEGRPAGH